MQTILRTRPLRNCILRYRESRLIPYQGNPCSVEALPGFTASCNSNLRAFATQSSDDQLSNVAAKSLLEPAIHYSMMHGLIYAGKELDADPSLATQCPVAMLPFKLPRHAFREAVALSPLWNDLVDAIARDLPWLYATLETAAQSDLFTKRLVDISKAVGTEGLRQKAYLGIHRSDYMLHEPDATTEPCFLQVELNTIASSMAAHAAKSTDLHRFLLSRYGAGTSPVAEAIQLHCGHPMSTPRQIQEHLPENSVLQHIPAALADAHKLYGAKDAVVVMVVQGAERNYADQRWFEYVLWNEHSIPLVRKTLREILDECVLDTDTGRLRFAGGAEISVVYFRAGYTPDDYPTEAEWEARLLLERSLAIKSPSVAYQLVGAKKVQQALARPGAVERFLSAEASQRLRASFAGLWGLGPDEDDADIVKKVIAEPEGYVMKPQREGGGWNFYGEGAAKKLQEMSKDERGAYILMQRILPKPQVAVLMREGHVQVMKSLSEFGFYSVFLGDGSSVYLSEHAGHLVRTKGEGVNEGGVAAGYAVISSPILID